MNVWFHSYKVVKISTEEFPWDQLNIFRILNFFFFAYNECFII